VDGCGAALNGGKQPRNGRKDELRVSVGRDEGSLLNLLLPTGMRLYRLLGPESSLAVLTTEIALTLTCYTVAATLLLPVDPVIFLWYDYGALRFLIVAFTILVVLYFQDLYDVLRVDSRFVLVQQFSLAIGIAFLLQAFLNYVDSSLVMPRRTMLLGSSLALVTLPANRVLFARLISTEGFAERVLFLGCSPLIERIHRRIRERPDLGLRAIGCVHETNGADELDCGTVLGDVNEFREIAEREKPDRIVVGLKERRNRMPQKDLLELRFSGVRIEEAATTYEEVFGRICVPELRPSQLIFSGELGPARETMLLQSIYSFALALFGLLLTLPVFLLAVVAVKLTSRGPALYRQTRVGKDGRVFTLYKIRSMSVDAEHATGAVWAGKNDPRVTRVGRWLRRFRIDEIPQLWNVLKGEMAVVGPRPERPEFVDTLASEIPFYRQRLAVKPGLTGWAQINAGYGNTVEDTITKLEYDLYYIKHMRPALDAFIIFHTVKVVLLGRGAL